MSRLKVKGRARPGPALGIALVPDGWYDVATLHHAAPVTQLAVREAVRSGRLRPRVGKCGKKVVEGRELIRWLRGRLRE